LGDGKFFVPNNGYARIEILDEFLITNYIGPIHAIVHNSYPNLLWEYVNPNFLQSRAILASNIETIDQINDHISSLIPGDEREYISFDSIDTSNIVENTPFEVIHP